jgi:hypothetical protein
MNSHILAFIVGLVALANGDVRDILKNQQSVFSAGQPFAKQQHHSAAVVSNAAGNSKRFWWAESPNSPFSKNINVGGIGCGSNCAPQHNTIHNTRHIQNSLPQQQQFNTKRQDYSHNPFMSGAFRQQQQPNFYAQMASLSGSPNEVNNLMADTFAPTRYYQAPKIPCYGALQVCAPKDACRNGLINENDLNLVQSQANVSNNLFFTIFRCSAWHNFNHLEDMYPCHYASFSPLSGISLA